MTTMIRLDIKLTIISGLYKVNMNTRSRGLVHILFCRSAKTFIFFFSFSLISNIKKIRNYFSKECYHCHGCEKKGLTLFMVNPPPLKFFGHNSRSIELRLLKYFFFSNKPPYFRLINILPQDIVNNN